MKLFQVNERDVVAAETEAAAREHYIMFCNQPETEVIDETVFKEIDVESEVLDVSQPWERATHMTMDEAFKQGFFTLPHVFMFKVEKVEE